MTLPGTDSMLSFWSLIRIASGLGWPSTCGIKSAKSESDNVRTWHSTTSSRELWAILGLAVGEWLAEPIPLVPDMVEVLAAFERFGGSEGEGFQVVFALDSGLSCKTNKWNALFTLKKTCLLE